MVASIDKVHLKCDCVEGSIVNGIRDQVLFSFNPNVPKGLNYKRSDQFCKKR